MKIDRVNREHWKSQYVIIGNPENRRIRLFQEALGRAGYLPAIVIAYSQLLAPSGRSREILHDALLRCPEDRSIVLRIDSFGESFDVEKRLIAYGDDHLADGSEIAGDRGSRISAVSAMRLKEDVGRIRFPTQAFAGFQKLMCDIESIVLKMPNVYLHQMPRDIVTMFDKSRCHARMVGLGVPVAETLPNVESFEHLVDRMASVNWTRAFVKLAMGSSASGVIALYLDSRQRIGRKSGQTIRAVTSMESCGTGVRRKFYNNLKLRVYHRVNEIRALIDYVCRERAHVEKWLPKATLGGRLFDLRVLVIAGKACHVVARTSRSPLTNLHLGNRRGDLDSLRRLMSRAQWKCTMSVAEQAASAFPSSLYMGVDVLLKPGFRDPTVLEVNAFGDLLPGVKCRGLSTYEAEIASQSRRQRGQSVSSNADSSVATRSIASSTFTDGMLIRTRSTP